MVFASLLIDCEKENIVNMEHANTGMLPDRPFSSSPEASGMGAPLTTANLNATNGQNIADKRVPSKRMSRSTSNSSNIAGAVTYHGMTISKYFFAVIV